MESNDRDMIDRGVCTSEYATCDKLHSTDWLKDILSNTVADKIFEVRFKNTRKDFYINVNDLKLYPGDIVAVEANPGHDIGIVSLKGELVAEQMKKYKVTTVNGEMRKIYRKARSLDIKKWKDAISLEYQTMIHARKIAQDMQLDMKIGDVEYQGDKTKAIFYYIADERVDFRKLIKVLADTFSIRVEMKQIGARQEAGRIGGIGSCGRELCCSTWISNFVSVTTNAARYQEISLNPQKLAGQCGKLKCCLNFEVDSYIDAQRDFPSNNIPLQTESGDYVFLKSDIFKGIYWYALQGNTSTGQVALSVESVKKIQELNKSGKKPEKLISDGIESLVKSENTFKDLVNQEDLDRFSRPKKKKSRKRKHRKNSKNQLTKYKKQ